MKITVLNYLREMAETGGGHGLFGHSCRTPEWWLRAADAIGADPYEMVRLVDESTVDLANKRKWTLQTLAEFSNSRSGRYAGDALSGVDGSPEKSIEACLRRYMTMFEKESK